MWVFCIYGFFSVACADDPEYVMVRARDIKHLLSLKRRFPDLAKVDIREWAARDYKYRIIISKVIWMAVLSSIAMEQTWSNVKDTVVEHNGDEGRAYVDAMHDVWARMYQLQK